LGTDTPSTAGSASLTKKDVDVVVKTLKDIRWELQQQRKMTDILRIQATQGVLAEVEAFTGAHQLSFAETLRKIKAERLSFARFGDGEFKLMLRQDYNLKFQPWSPELARDLRDLLTMRGYDSSRLLLGFPYIYRDVHWSGVWLDIWPQISPLLDESIAYGNSHVSRPVFFQRMKEQGVELWRDVWDDLDVCVVTGADSRFELLGELFDNVRSARTVHSLAVDAYSDLPRLLEELRADDTHTDLYLVSLGPAGTLLAAELSTMGRWALDVGHISDSYVNVFDGGVWPEFQSVTKKKA